MASRSVVSSATRGLARSARSLTRPSSVRVSLPVSRCFSSLPSSLVWPASTPATPAVRHSSSATNTSGDYVSPFSDFFQAIADGKTTLSAATGTAKTPPTEQSVRYLKCGIPESVLRFRTVSYGRMLIEPHVQPGEHKVTLKIGMHHLPLETELEHKIFRQIVGRRYMEARNELWLSSDQFASRIENKRHLVSMLDRIVINTKRLAQEVEAGEDGASAET